MSNEIYPAGSYGAELQRIYDENEVEIERLKAEIRKDLASLPRWIRWLLIRVWPWLQEYQE